MFALAPYKPHYLSGLVIDNNVKYQNLWLRELGGTPDYIVVPRQSDYIAARNLGMPLSSTQDLVLYH